LEEAHHALPDAEACGKLLHALGEELLSKRCERLLSGFQAFVPRGSAFDRAVLQPRKIETDAQASWKLDATPAIPKVLVHLNDVLASSNIVQVLTSTMKEDVLIE